MLDYFALVLLIFVALVLFYGIIVIHDIPYDIAKARNHPQQDAIHVAGWVSLLTLHTIWPFLWIWSTMYRPDRGWGFGKLAEDKEEITQIKNIMLQMQAKLINLETEEKDQIKRLQSRIEVLESKDNEGTP